MSSPEFAITPTPGTPPMLFVDHEPTGRSGHLGHALFQNTRGEIYGFYPSCSGGDFGGHSAIGWMEYKVSTDGGASWGPPRTLELSKRIFESGTDRSLFSEKAVVTANGTVVLFHLISDISRTPDWQPYGVPLATRSTDGGTSWEEPIEVGADRGRIYDATYLNNTIYVLKFRNDATSDYCGTLPEHVYELFVSRDDGQNFDRLATLPFDTLGRCYGTLGELADGRLIAYIYNAKDEYLADYCVSADGGKTWSRGGAAFMPKRLRNPQLVRLGQHWFMHGRSGSHGPADDAGHLVLYHSRDGLTWDDGTYLVRRTAGYGAYSNNMVVTDPQSGRRRVRIHASHAYSQNRTNIVAWWIDLPD